MCLRIHNGAFCSFFVQSGIKNYFDTIHINFEIEKKWLGTILHFELRSLWSINDGGAKDMPTAKIPVKFHQNIVRKLTVFL